MMAVNLIVDAIENVGVTIFVAIIIHAFVVRK
jgi:hypothetical protein